MSKKNRIRLGVNIDHIATLQRLRDTPYPSVLRAALICEKAGADQITVHLREDRRHIQDHDVFLLKKKLKIDLNLEMAATDEMCKIALRCKPYSICIVPEKRQERTTEGGLNLDSKENISKLKRITKSAKAENILVSYFIETNPEHVSIAKECGAQAVEFHTGTLCRAIQEKNSKLEKTEWKKLIDAMNIAEKNKLYVHVGHGIDFDILRKLKKYKQIKEMNIGHWIICNSVIEGLENTILRMRKELK